MPSAMSASATVLARRSESRWLYSSLPIESVWPSTATRRVGYLFRRFAASWIFAFPSAVRLYLANSKLAPGMFAIFVPLAGGGGGGGGGGGAGASLTGSQMT